MHADDMAVQVWVTCSTSTGRFKNAVDWSYQELQNTIHSCFPLLLSDRAFSFGWNSHNLKRMVRCRLQQCWMPIWLKYYSSRWHPGRLHTQRMPAALGSPSLVVVHAARPSSFAANMALPLRETRCEQGCEEAEGHTETDVLVCGVSRENSALGKGMTCCSANINVALSGTRSD